MKGFRVHFHWGAFREAAVTWTVAWYVYAAIGCIVAVLFGRLPWPPRWDDFLFAMFAAAFIGPPILIACNALGTFVAALISDPDPPEGKLPEEDLDDRLYLDYGYRLRELLPHRQGRRRKVRPDNPGYRIRKRCRAPGADNAGHPPGPRPRGMDRLN